MDYKKLTRREALKYLGTTVAGMTLASTSALSIFTSCTEKGKKRIVFYFTATGNGRLYAAKKFSETAA
ncbi:MAG: twin-arginine translocation signal domain-containing protein [Parabacteroides sp.]